MNKRVLKPHSGNFEPPINLHPKTLSSADVSLIKHLSEEFISLGALDSEHADEFKASAAFQEIFWAAAAAAQTEKDTNPENYSEYADSLIENRSAHMDEYENPALDGVDDYGRQIYKNEKESRVPIEPTYVVSPVVAESDYTSHISEDEYADEMEGKSTFEALEETMGEKGVSSPFAGGIQNKSVEAKPFERIDFKAIKNQPPKMLHHKKEVDPEARPTEPLDADTVDMYAKALAKARLPNGGLI